MEISIEYCSTVKQDNKRYRVFIVVRRCRRGRGRHRSSHNRRHRHCRQQQISFENFVDNKPKIVQQREKEREEERIFKLKLQQPKQQKHRSSSFCSKTKSKDVNGK